MTNNLLDGVKVVELATVLAGPLVGSFLSEMGATVVKIENSLSQGDITRQWKNSAEDPRAFSSSYYQSANFNKESLFLDFNSEIDLHRVHALIKGADIVIGNFQKKVGEKFKLDPYSITESYPHIIYVQLDAYSYGDSRKGFDIVMQAESGYLSMCGCNDNALAKIPVAMMDILASHQMREGLLLSWIKKLQSGKGCKVFVSLFDSALTGLVNQASNYLNNGVIAKPMGTSHPNIAPYGEIYNTNDGHKILLAVGSDAQFGKLARIMSLSDDEISLFASNAMRTARREELYEKINEFMGRIGIAEVKSLLDNEGIPYGVVKNLGDVLEEESVKPMLQTDKENNRTIKNIAFKMINN
jgi:crotonobetainyl-CoA:carnitine CoA-transferase CaiB-like acyl-CoA transferase